jgi:DNA-binding SARP family transcriptional activator
VSTESVTGPDMPVTTVIKAKLAIPPLPARRVERPRVERRLADLVERHRTVVVSATAGAGKTTAVAAAVRLLEQPVAWLTVDRGDAAPGRLVTYLEAALANALPEAGGAATEALAAGIPHPEAAGLLAEAVGDSNVVFVLDDLESFDDQPDAWAVIAALMRYAPAGLHSVLVSRRKIPAVLRPIVPVGPAIAALGEGELAFTPDEAAVALGQLGETGVDADAAVEVTGGWVTGVLFEAWRAADHVVGMGGEADPLNGYLSSQILDDLSLADREFLITTALLDEVTVPRAQALGQSDAAERLARLAGAHLPVTWRPDGRGLRCHKRFREYLLDCLERRGRDEVRALLLAYGRLLADEGHYEEATDVLLEADAPTEALASAEHAIVQVIERLDFAVAERWLAAFADTACGPASPLTTAELMLAYAQEDFRRAVRVADRLAARGERDDATRSSELAAVLMYACYMTVGRVDDAYAVMAAVPAGQAADVLRYSLATLTSGQRPPRPDETGGPLDVMIISVDYVRGRIAGLLDEQRSGWVYAVAEPWRIGALAVAGHTERALELYEEIRSHGVATAWLESYFGPIVLIDAGRRDEARDTIERGRRLARASGSVILQFSNQLEEARFALRLDRDPAAARAALDRLAEGPGVRSFPVITEQLDTWYGLALLLESDDVAALARLRSAVESMTGGDRMLELPTAAVYLAEAEWRAGDEEAADRAADLALDAARLQGSNHALLRALADFPAVVSRRIDAEPAADSPWHELGRALIAQGVAIAARPHASVDLEEFGRARILVNGQEARPRIANTYELLAYMSARPGAEATREELLDALFDSRDDESTRAYLRQAIRWLRNLLPDPAGLVTEEGRVSFAQDVSVSSESTRLEAKLAEAARLRGDDRRAATLAALTVHDRGEYLPDTRSAWAEERRARLRQLAADARYEAAELAFGAERYDEAEALVRQVLDDEPFRETGWRLVMRIANALGDDDAVVRAYQACERALADIGTTPAASTRALLEQLRR